MSKELTEQWRNGTLEDGFYYVKENNEVFISPCSKHYLLSVLNDCEVLAPVPTYDQFVELTEKVGELSSENGRLKYDNDVLSTVNDELTKKVKKLEEQLEEAEDVIRFYANADKLTEEEKQMSVEKYHLVYGLKAYDYIERYGVE